MNPRVTLLIPMRNEMKFIGDCLASVISQDYPSDLFEVIVIDGMSTDDSKKIVSRVIQSSQNINMILNPQITQSSAWNLGIKIAKGEIVGIVSAHCELAPDYITNLVETIQRTGADMVGGPTYADSKGLMAHTIALALNSPFGVGNARFHYAIKEIEVDTVFMGACLRLVFERIGGFDEEMVRNQDDEFSYRLREHGGRIICNPAIRSRYFNQASLQGLWKQYFQYGYYKIRVLQKHPKQMGIRQFIPPLFVLSLIISIIFSLTNLSKWPLFIIACSYLISNIAASIITASKKGWKYLVFLPVTFLAIHLSYGFGFLYGLIKFWNRWRDIKGKIPEFS